MTKFDFSKTIEELEQQRVHVVHMQVGETLEPVRLKLLELIDKHITEIRSGVRSQISSVLSPEQDERQ